MIGPMLPDVSVRFCQAELMDDPRIDPGRHQRALAGLRRINRISGAADPIFAELAQLARQSSDDRLRVLDLACGGGDVTIELAHRAREGGFAMEFTGCDISPTALAAARQRARREQTSVDFVPADVLRDDLPGGFDVVFCSLFMHHLRTDDAGRLLSRMARSARRMVLVSDLDRSLGGYLAAWVGTRVLSLSPIVRTDGPRSVRAAFTVAEIARIAQDAGLDGVSVRPIRPWRWLLRWRRP